MKFPNRRYGNPEVLRHFAQFMTIPELSRRFRRSQRTIQNWIQEREKMPFWVEELLLLQEQARRERLRQMNIKHRAPLFAISNAKSVESPPNTLQAPDYQRTPSHHCYEPQPALKHA